MKHTDERTKSLIKVLAILLPVALITHTLNLTEVEYHLWKAIVSYVIAILFMNEFDQYIKKRKNENGSLDYCLTRLFALIVFLAIEFIMDKNILIFYILIILIILFGFAVYLIFKNGKSNFLHTTYGNS